MLFRVEDHILFLTKAGSHAYGTALADSDLDVKGVCLPPKEIRLSYRQRFDQLQGDVPTLRARVLPSVQEPWDGTIFSLSKAVHLMAENNPNVLELLFVDPSSVLLTSPTWERLRAIRHEFLSQKCFWTFMGYAHAQLKKIESHRKFLLSPPTKEPQREDFGLPPKPGKTPEQAKVEEAIRKQVNFWGVQDLGLTGDDLSTLQDKVVSFQEAVWQAQPTVLELDQRVKTLLAGASLGVPEDLLSLLDREQRYLEAKRQFQAFTKWKTERSPKRAALEAKAGYDSKHGSHLLRLARCCVEILRSGEFWVMRPDAQELREIREGHWSFDRLMDEFRRLESEATALVKTTSLPKTPNHSRIDEELISILSEETPMQVTSGIRWEEVSKLTRTQWDLVTRVAREGFGVNLFRTENEVVVDPLPLPKEVETTLADLIQALGR